MGARLLFAAQTTGATTDRFIHGPRGLHAQQDAAGTWTHPLQDGLGSVRGTVDEALAAVEAWREGQDV